MTPCLLALLLASRALDDALPGCAVNQMQTHQQCIEGTHSPWEGTGTCMAMVTSLCPDEIEDARYRTAADKLRLQADRLEAQETALAKWRKALDDCREVQP